MTPPIDIYLEMLMMRSKLVIERKYAAPHQDQTNMVVQYTQLDWAVHERFPGNYTIKWNTMDSGIDIVFDSEADETLWVLQHGGGDRTGEWRNELRNILTNK